MRLRIFGFAVALGVQLTPASADQPLTLSSAGSVEIAHSKGKFDFLRVDAKRNRLLAAHEKDGTSDFIDLKSLQLLGRIKLGSAVDTAMDPESNTYYVSVQEANRIAIVDTATLKETGSIALAGPSDAVIYEPKNKRIYITHDDGTDVWVIDPDAKKVVATIAIPGVPEYMEYDPGADRIYLNIKDKNVVAVVDPNSNSVVAQWPTAPAQSPHGMALDAVHHRVFSAGGNGKLVAIDTKTGAMVSSLDISPKVDQIALDASGGFLYCAGAQMSVVKVSGDKLSLVGNLEVSPSARNVAVDPTTHVVWTTYTDGTNSYAKGWNAPSRQ